MLLLPGKMAIHPKWISLCCMHLAFYEGAEGLVEKEEEKKGKSEREIKNSAHCTQIHQLL